MTSLNNRLYICNINNNDSDVSSGSGYYVEEHPDYDSLYYMKPPSYNNEVIVTTTSITDMATTDTITLHSLNEINNKLENKAQLNDSKTETRKLLFGVPLNSSQESSFEGFGSSPLDKLQRVFYPNQQPQLEQQQTLDKSPKKNALEALEKHSPGKIVFSKFYDTIVDENSCNAVDIQIPRDSLQTHTRCNSTESNKSNDSNMKSLSELSFNGKIKSLTNMQEATYPCNSELVFKRRLSNLMETSVNTSLQFSESFILKKYSNEKSPDLFGEDDDEEEEGINDIEDDKQTKTFTAKLEKSTQPTALTCNLADNSFNCPTESSFANDDQTMDCNLTHGLSGHSSDFNTLFKENCQREREMLRRTRKCLAGVLPPPSVTIPQLDMISVVLSKKNDILNFLNDINNDSSTQSLSKDCTTSATRQPSLFHPTHTLEETKTMPWRDILGVRQHGLCYNLNKASESNEYLSLSVMERFIGAETTSSYQNSPSSAKKRNNRLKLLCQSPGNRLSHLAKRRAIFSSANLATQKCSTIVGPQILLDKKKIKNRLKPTPKRLTPASKKKNRKTPTSSARKRLFHNDNAKSGVSRETSKRALFQSPAKHVQQTTSLPKLPAMKPELANRIEKSKRALLFSPEKQEQSEDTSSSGRYFAPATQLDMLLKRKRNQVDDDVSADELSSQSSKLFKAEVSTNLTPRALKIKSESFCIGAGSSAKSQQIPCGSSLSTVVPNMSGSLQNLQRNSSVTSILGAKLQKAYSDNTAQSNSLTENQKKKLLWAVSQALQERKITVKHESFKQYAAVLARVVKRIFQEYYQKNSTSNSETLLRLAKKYSYSVTGGSSADDIYIHAKKQIEDSKRQSYTRLSGYIGPEEYQRLKQQQSLSQTSSQSLTHKGSTHNILNPDNSFDSFGLISQSSSGFCDSSTQLSQNSFMGQISQDLLVSEASQTSNSHSASKSIPINTSLQNSSSKNNLCSVVLRENVDCELRRSAQKNFTGKDQRNMSPYTGGNNNSGSAVKAHSQLITDIANTGAKAKRQIKFDS